MKFHSQLFLESHISNSMVPVTTNQYILSNGLIPYIQWLYPRIPYFYTMGWNQWPFQDPKMEVPTIYKAYEVPTIYVPYINPVFIPWGIFHHQPENHDTTPRSRPWWDICEVTWGPRKMARLAYGHRMAGVSQGGADEETTHLGVSCLMVDFLRKSIGIHERMPMKTSSLYLHISTINMGPTNYKLVYKPWNNPHEN